ncbi:hypothetical protein [Edaphobacter sp.]|uniref:hypothetical protein n=1 Tax=Edaphobacter sp. TaxID=1934404 RepID=UPI002DB949BC|nr:hypothetical protein [Edaphobacter sp.]HEU5342340.1 hypothetical protein [Edaphobacter sp.]
MPGTQPHRPDEGMSKGAVENDAFSALLTTPRSLNCYFVGQLGHRDQDEMLKDNDTDFPGLDAEAEHSGR